MTWNPLRKDTYLTHKPQCAPGVIDREKDKELEDMYVKLQKLEESNKRIIKDMKRFVEGINNLSKAENKLVNDLAATSVCQRNENFRGLVEEYVSVTSQVGKSVVDVSKLCQKTVTEPMKKYHNEFSGISTSFQKRDGCLADVARLEGKLQKLQEKEKTVAHGAKRDLLKKQLKQAIVDAQQTHDKLLEELPRFYALRGAYITPSLQAFTGAQMEYYGTTLRLFTHLANMSVSGDSAGATPKKMSEVHAENESKLNQLRSLTIVGSHSSS